MEITNWKQILEKELVKGIKHSMRTKPFLKANWCPENPN
jgi:hypothetical protein